MVPICPHFLQLAAADDVIGKAAAELQFRKPTRIGDSVSSQIVMLHIFCCLSLQ